MNFKLYFYLFAIILLSGILQASSENKTQHYLEAAHKQMNISLEKALVYSEKALIKARNENDILSIAEALFLKGYARINLGSIEPSLEVFQEGLDYSRERNLSRFEIKFLVEIGNIYYNKGEFDKGASFYRKALKLSRDYDFTDQEAVALHFIGKYYHSLGRFQSSYQYYLKASHINDSIDEFARHALVLNDIGKHFESVGDFGKSLEHYLEAERMLEKEFDAITYASNCNHLGNLYEKLGNFKKSLNYHHLALKTRKNLGYKEGVAKSLKNIGEVYIRTDSTEKALASFYQSLNICRKVSYEKGIIKNNNNIGSILTDQGKQKEALSYLKEALEKSEKIGYEKGIVLAHKNLGKLHNALRNYAESQYHLSTAALLAEQRNMDYFLKDIYFQLYVLAINQNESGKALNQFRKYHEVYQEVNDLEMQNQIAELQTMHDLEKQESANEMLRKENEIKPLKLSKQSQLIWFFVAGMVFLILLVGIIAIKLYQRKKLNLRLSELNQKIVHQHRIQEKLNKELKTANREKDKFFNIIAHEIRNPLWWFRKLAENLSASYTKMPPEKIHEALKSLDESAQNAFHLMDNLLNWSRTRLNRISPDIKRVCLQELVYEQIDLFQNMANARGIEIKTEVDENICVMADRDMLNTVLRNLASNALKYTPEGGSVEFIAENRNDSVTVTVSDSGIGIKEKNLKKLFRDDIQYTTLGISQEKGSGVGLLLCRDFISMNNGDIYVESELDKGTMFIFTLPAA